MTDYTPGTLSSSIIGNSVDTTLNDLFQKSAGPSQLLTKPAAVYVRTPKGINATKQAKAKSKTQNAQALAKKAVEAANKARSLAAMSPLKRKRNESIQPGTVAKKSATDKNLAPETPEEKRAKDARTVFVGNVPVECIEKAGSKELKAKFAECGNVESIRFRSVAFAEPMARKAAFITKRVHEDREAVNAYVVYKTKEEATKALDLNGTVFMGKHLRVDRASNMKQHDRKRSVFLGSLPFDCQEEELWTFFKDCGEVESVRIIRDTKTNVGKGFGYVQFTDRASVEAALSLEDKTFRSNHTIRIQRCKVSASEGGVPSAPRKAASARGTRSNGRPQRGNKITGISGKLIPSGKLHEGTRASKNDSQKLKMKKKNPTAKKSNNKKAKK
ncbi:hypothetical protein J3Q64DRAFT_1027626 [Phycomyces blakesleeanus]|uniref:Nucleolar protein 12 n=2 Tax=Phycomyces blakesleeanus TaxID=4837 RepID=A0A167P5G7_PHYB8|nr:hypothetical protein PHYBLDRAFT_141166 [Phycomyces blakesleeanus NRRL 1555(-)]OAD77281.1 hypothetical protein PHYBLDRAFT_141166 [Phycomyces blakesleeanus NRRL 1555(-)]|eukprot:XP_018295321.1 hypothetical protein PHYBLDRAFT_141166 [Phycomyces blakesleeanus NRRL 1555(-)]